jgi:3-dehydroquinate synthase
MGSGKTTVGRRLAELLGSPFIDLDEYISTRFSRSINEIFSCVGEPGFRTLERDALLEVATKESTTVVATGGGLPLNPSNRAVMKAVGSIVFLQSSFESLAVRIPAESGRPLWNENARDLLKERTPAYGDADLVVNTDDLTVQEVAAKISGMAKGLPDPVAVLVPGAPYPVYLGRGIFREVKKFIARHIQPEGVLALVDEQVLLHHGRLIRSTLAGLSHSVITVPSGEASKSFSTLTKVLDRMFAARANRQWVCLAVGGGVTGDLAAFASSIFMRGIPVIQVPTTLLAQVDSSIGGKTAIDVKHGKNLVGTFHQPLFVLSDIGFLDTLDPLQKKDAMSEVIKYGIIMDRVLFEELEASDEPDYERTVARCTRDKASVVSRDEREGGLRRILNFGHTLGHAVEASRDFQVSHGIAVAAGMYFASWLSRELGLIELKEMDRIFRLIRKWICPLQDISYPGADEIGTALIMDKKGSQEGIHFVLTPGIGGATVKNLTSSQILGAYGRFVRECEEGL